MHAQACERMRKFSPTGEAVKTTCKYCLTLEMKVAQQFSAESTRPRDLVSLRIALTISSLSSCAYARTCRRKWNLNLTSHRRRVRYDNTLGPRW